MKKKRTDFSKIFQVRVINHFNNKLKCVRSHVRFLIISGTLRLIGVFFCFARQLSKTKHGHKPRSKGFSYSRYFKAQCQIFLLLEHTVSLSLRSGEASAAPNAGVADRLFKRHGPQPKRAMLKTAGRTFSFLRGAAGRRFPPRGKWTNGEVFSPSCCSTISLISVCFSCIFLFLSLYVAILYLYIKRARALARHIQS